MSDYRVNPPAPVISRPADQACPRCREEQLVDEVVTGRNSYRFCGVCGYDWEVQNTGPEAGRVPRRDVQSPEGWVQA